MLNTNSLAKILNTSRQRVNSWIDNGIKHPDGSILYLKVDIIETGCRKNYIIKEDEVTRFLDEYYKITPTYYWYKHIKIED